MINQYREAYKKINNSASYAELIYPLTNRGFFSEINNLALAVLYCLENNIKLKVYTKYWVGGNWNDYFNPILKEYKGIVPIPRDIFVKRRYDPIYRIYHKYIKNREIIQDGIWNEMGNKQFIEKHFYFPELGIDGSIFEAKKQIFDIILDYNNETIEEVFSLSQTDLNFIQNSCGIHVRRGDKVSGKSKEAELFDVAVYINKINEIGANIQNITVCTDDFEVLRDFEKHFPEFKYLTFCELNRSGYFQSDYNKTENKAQKRAEVINVLKDANLLINSKVFVGAYSSNISRFVAVMRNNKECYSLDIDWTPS